MVKPRDIDTLPPEKPGHTPDLAVVFCDLPPDFPISAAELDAIAWLLGDDLQAFLGKSSESRTRY
jgi:hypothetical protein